MNDYQNKLYDDFMDKKTEPRNLMPDETNAQEALDLLKDYILGSDYYIVDPVNQKQANTIIVLDIIHRLEKEKQERRNNHIFSDIILKIKNII